MKHFFIYCMLLLLSWQAHAQVEVKGRVLDDEGKPLPGTTVLEEGTSNGTATDADGQFTMNVSSPQAVLLFEFVGYEPLRYPLNGRTSIEVRLKPSALSLQEVAIVGSRSLNRSVTETPVAVDVLDVQKFTNDYGQVEINQLLHYVAPSFNANRQSGADGADHIMPATLRGLGPDQTLVLINGKRRHQSSLINIFGSRGRGNTGTDLNAIPAAAIERIEILRDGASAQYGSDAIAGVINIVLKSDVDKGSLNVTTGMYNAQPPSQYDVKADKQFDGETVQVAANYGVALGKKGFINTTIDFLKQNHTNRPADPAKFDIYRRQFGSAAVDNFRTFVNAELPLNNTAAVYAFGGYSQRYTDAYAWTREANSERNVPQIYPNGFDPRITSDIRDISFSAGVRSKFKGWDVDFNNTYGRNYFHYIIDGTLNASLGVKSPTRFDAGGHAFSQNITGLHFTRYYKNIMQGFNLAFGTEYRIDRYQIFAGEEASWKDYDDPDDPNSKPGGSQGFPGFRPENEVDESRYNLAFYIDGELDITQKWLVAAAARFENYSDFGSTFTAKLASRYALSKQLAVRGSVSTGFRAPSLAQIYYNTTFTDFVSGQPVDKIIAKNNSPITRTLGIPQLKQEESLNASLGFTFSNDVFSATIDGYMVDVRDRIVLTGAFEDTDPDIGADLQALGVGAAQFFTNALDTRTFGLDVILAYVLRMSEEHSFTFSLAGNFNTMELGAVKTSAKLRGKEDIYFGEREKHFLLASAPPSKITASIDYQRNRFNANIRAVRFDKVVLIDWLGTEDIYNPVVVTDVTLGYDLYKNISLKIGASNLFNVYPTQQDTETETGGLWDAVQHGTDGAFYFSKLIVRF
ncbi:TonB-dependent receptor [Thermonema rossianum]|uniref:TonB-dependent receptor n=1 Tax=Thermonema rossianum TaxID=55505 RepID=UPI00056DD73F|nr:TonB-dependent receptor [Thermonema rossianum]